MSEVTFQHMLQYITNRKFNYYTHCIIKQNYEGRQKFYRGIKWSLRAHEAT